MKVLTVWQPWANLIAVGAKPYEFRGRVPPKAYVGQRIAINAAKRQIDLGEVHKLIRTLESDMAWSTCLKPELALPMLIRVFDNSGKNLPLGAIVCTAVLGAPRNGFDIAKEFGGFINDSDRNEHANFGWPMLEVEPVIPAVEHRGQQGWSEWSGR